MGAEVVQRFESLFYGLEGTTCSFSTSTTKNLYLVSPILPARLRSTRPNHCVRRDGSILRDILSVVSGVFSCIMNKPAPRYDYNSFHQVARVMLRRFSGNRRREMSGHLALIITHTFEDTHRQTVVQPSRPHVPHPRKRCEAHFPGKSKSCHSPSK